MGVTAHRFSYKPNKILQNGKSKKAGYKEISKTYTSLNLSYKYSIIRHIVITLHTMKQQKIIYIHFNDSKREQQDYFFGSMTGAYSVLTEEEMGIKYRSLLEALSDRNTYKNPYISVVVGELFRKPHIDRRSNEAD